MVRRLIKKRIVVSSSSPEENPESLSTGNENMDMAEPSTAPEEGDKGKETMETKTEEGPQSIVSVVTCSHAIFGAEAERFAPMGFCFRGPDADDRVCLPRTGEVGFYLPCVEEMGLRFPVPSFFVVLLHVMGIPLYMLSANSSANVIGFLVACGLQDLPLLVNVFRFFFHTVLSEGYYVIQARRSRKIIMNLNPKVKEWKNHFAFVRYPEGAAMPGPPVLDLEGGGLDWMNENPTDYLSPRALDAVAQLKMLSEDERQFANLATSENIRKFAWDKKPLMSSDLEKMLNKVAATRQKESDARVAKIRKSALGGHASGISIVGKSQAQTAAPEGLPSAMEQLRQSTPVSGEAGVASKSPKISPAMAAPSPPVLTTPEGILERGMAPSQTAAVESQAPAHATPLQTSSFSGSRKRSREEEKSPATERAGPDESVWEGPVEPVTTPMSTATEAGGSQPGEGTATSLSILQVITAHAEGVAQGVKRAVNMIFDEEVKEITECSNRARARIIDKSLKMAKLCTQYKVEAETEKKRAEKTLERLRAARAEERESQTAELRRQLKASEAKEKKTMDLLKLSDAARDQMKVELSDAQKALNVVKAELVTERRERDAAEAALAGANNQIIAQRGTIGLRDKKISDLEGNLQQQVACSEKLRAQANRVVELEEQVVKAKELEAETLAKIRAEAVDEYMNREVQGILYGTMERGAVEGRKEGFSTGFYQALKMVGSRYPDLIFELRQFSLEQAQIDVDAALAAEVQAQLEAANNKAQEATVPGKGKMVKELA